MGEASEEGSVESGKFLSLCFVLIWLIIQEWASLEVHGEDDALFDDVLGISELEDDDNQTDEGSDNENDDISNNEASDEEGTAMDDDPDEEDSDVEADQGDDDGSDHREDGDDDDNDE